MEAWSRIRPASAAENEHQLLLALAALAHIIAKTANEARILSVGRCKCQTRFLRNLHNK